MQTRSNLRSRLSHTLGLPLCAVSMMFFVGAGPEGGCGEGLDNRAGEPGLDVGGPTGAKWALSYTDDVEVIIKNGAAIVSSQTVSLAAGGAFDLDGITINLSDLCAREDVACPHEVFPYEVKMTQPGNQLHLLYVAFNPEGPLSNLNQTTLVGNVDSDFDFSIALGIKGAVVGPCGLLAVSYATGNITSDGGVPPNGTSLQGDIVTAYHGGCIVGDSTGAAAAGLTVEIRVPFSGQRQ